MYNFVFSRGVVGLTTEHPSSVLCHVESIQVRRNQVKALIPSSFFQLGMCTCRFSFLFDTNPICILILCKRISQQR